MKSMAVILTSLSVMLSAATLSAEPQQVMSADDLKQLCAGTDHVSRNVCRIYILGVTQGITLGMNIADGKTRGGRPCVPEQISAETLEQTMKAKLDQELAAKPAAGELDASRFIGSVLLAAYPCSQGSH
jgi:hypothetical protein